MRIENMRVESGVDSLREQFFPKIRCMCCNRFLCAGGGVWVRLADGTSCQGKQLVLSAGPWMADLLPAAKVSKNILVHATDDAGASDHTR